MGQIIEHKATEVPSRAVVTPMEMLDRAVTNGAGIETLTQLMNLQERWEASQARKAFDEAMASAKSEIPVIIKNRTVDFKGKNSDERTTYRHEDLAEIARTVDPILAKHGLSYRYLTTSEPNQPITVTCIVAHRDGHSERNTLMAPKDDSGKKNSIQAIGSTVTYLQRYTLKAALGLAAATDDDGASSEDKGNISDAQREELQGYIEKLGDDVANFCGWMRVSSLAEIPEAQFQKAKQALHAKAAKIGVKL